MKRNLLLILLISLLSFYSCTDFEYSPNQAFDKDSPTNLNAKNLAKLNLINNDDTLRFIIFGDPQKSTNELDLFIAKANSIKNIDMVFLAGDISEFGLLQETKWVAEQLQNLKMPNFVVIGNHDLLAKGRAVFERMFGQLNYSVVYDGVKFICHDTNGREYKFNGQVPNINWLNKELEPQAGVVNYVAVSHVRPFTPDFDSKLDTSYVKTFSSRLDVLASFHAHEHEFGGYFPLESKVPFLVTTNIGSKGFLLAEIVNHEITYERVSF
jgi:Icc protein